jgi:hypothetical protein
MCEDIHELNHRHCVFIFTVRGAHLPEIIAIYMRKTNFSCGAGHVVGHSAKNFHVKSGKMREK